MDCQNFSAANVPAWGQLQSLSWLYNLSAMSTNDRCVWALPNMEINTKMRKSQPGSSHSPIEISTCSYTCHAHLPHPPSIHPAPNPPALVVFSPLFALIVQVMPQFQNSKQRQLQRLKEFQMKCSISISFPSNESFRLLYSDRDASNKFPSCSSLLFLVILVVNVFLRQTCFIKKGGSHMIYLNEHFVEFCLIMLHSTITSITHSFAGCDCS